jgi:hypothetical protein
MGRAPTPSPTATATETDVNAGRWLVSLLACSLVASACSGESAPVASACIKVVEESGQTIDECLPVSPDGHRVDLSTPTFTHPTSITNLLHPTSQVQQTIYGGHVDGKPFRTEVSLLPVTKPIAWQGNTVDTAVIQYVAYLDGRIHEVAIDWYAQADDGSVWYFGEDVFNYEDGTVADTKGTWVAGDTTPAAMIMPAQPRVGSVYRPENAPGIAFEEVRVDKVDQQIDGPSGKISGAIEVNELHMDGTREGKVFAPGYGEFSTGSAGGDLEAASLASPTDRRQGAAPAEFAALSQAVDGVYTADPSHPREPAYALTTAWEAVRAKGIPAQMDTQMQADIAALNGAIGEQNAAAAQSAALRIAQNELDLRLLYQPVIDVDLARLKLWTRQLPFDVAVEDAGLVLANVAALDRVWERTRHGVDPAPPVDAALQDLRKAADAEDLAAVDRTAEALTRVVGALHTR